VVLKLVPFNSWLPDRYVIRRWTDDLDSDNTAYFSLSPFAVKRNGFVELSDILLLLYIHVCYYYVMSDIIDARFSHAVRIRR